jgi:ASC-1-like (ASCH) protein
MPNAHTMSLYREGFELIRSGRKKIEVRLCDDKRRQMQVGERLTFQKLPERLETIKTQITDIKQFENFEVLYRAIGLEPLGRADKDMKWMMEKTRELYTAEDEAKCGAMAIFFKICENGNQD